MTEWAQGSNRVPSGNNTSHICNHVKDSNLSIRKRFHCDGESVRRSEQDGPGHDPNHVKCRCTHVARNTIHTKEDIEANSSLSIASNGEKVDLQDVLDAADRLDRHCEQINNEPIDWKRQRDSKSR
jgi:hypothetical protein